MDTIFLAQAIGLFALVIGISMLVKHATMLDIFHEVAQQRALSYIMGVIMLMIGLFLVLTHPTRTGTAALCMTFLGGGIVLESLVFLFGSQKLLVNYMRTLNNSRVYYSISIGYLLLGAYFSWFGFTN